MGKSEEDVGPGEITLSRGLESDGGTVGVNDDGFSSGADGKSKEDRGGVEITQLVGWKSAADGMAIDTQASGGWTDERSLESARPMEC